MGIFPQLICFFLNSKHFCFSNQVDSFSWDSLEQKKAQIGIDHVRPQNRRNKSKATGLLSFSLPFSYWIFRALTLSDGIAGKSCHKQGHLYIAIA